MQTTATPSPASPNPSRDGSLSELGALRAFVNAIQNRIIAGLLLALPFAITFWIIYQLYITLQGIIFQPVARVIQWAIGPERMANLPGWWTSVVAPFVAIICVLAILYVLGLFVRSRALQLIDWVITRVPLVTNIYQAVRGVFQSLQSQRGGSRFKRVVLVAYPHAGMRAPGFVMKSMQAVGSGRTILSVFVPFAPIPTSGLVLLVPEDEVTDLNWSVNETMQAIISGGLSVPAMVQYPVISPEIHLTEASVEPAV